jgi:hypothetical protein
MVDMRDTIEAKSDQLNAEDIATPKVLLITSVKKTSGDQPVSIGYEGDKGKPWKPCKSMRRILVKAWGADGEQFIGKSVEVYNDPKVKWAGEEIGGIRISKMSHMDRTMRTVITLNGKKRVPYTVEVLDVAPPKPERTLDERKEACKAALKTAGFELTEDDLESLSEIDNAKSLAEFFNSFKKEEA